MRKQHFEQHWNFLLSPGSPLPSCVCRMPLQRAAQGWEGLQKQQSLYASVLSQSYSRCLGPVLLGWLVKSEGCCLVRAVTSQSCCQGLALYQLYCLVTIFFPFTLPTFPCFICRREKLYSHKLIFNSDTRETFRGDLTPAFGPNCICNAGNNSGTIWPIARTVAYKHWYNQK